MPSRAAAYLQWKLKRIPFKIEVNTGELYVAVIRNKLRSRAGFDHRNWSLAAQLNAQYKVDLNEALLWANKAMDPTIGGAEDFQTLNAKAVVLYTLDRYDEAEVVMDKAIHIPGTPVLAIHQYGRVLLQGGKKEKALEVFQ